MIRALFTRLRCFVRQSHIPVRHPLGGFRCGECGEAGADLDDMGYLGGGYVTPIRKVFNREHHELTRTAAWEPTRRGW